MARTPLASLSRSPAPVVHSVRTTASLQCHHYPEVHSRVLLSLPLGAPTCRSARGSPRLLDVEVGLIDAFTLRGAAMMGAKEKIDAITGGCPERAPLDMVRLKIVAWPEHLVSSYWRT